MLQQPNPFKQQVPLQTPFHVIHGLFIGFFNAVSQVLKKEKSMHLLVRN